MVDTSVTLSLATTTSSMTTIKPTMLSIMITDNVHFRHSYEYMMLTVPVSVTNCRFHHFTFVECNVLLGVIPQYEIDFSILIPICILMLNKKN